jgi:hypothetical protein
MKPLPRIPTFLLAQVADCDQALIGDLAEEYRADRSQWWFWQQAGHAVVRAIATQIRHHPVLTVRGILVLGAMMVLLFWGAGAAHLERLPGLLVSGPVLMRFQLPMLTVILVVFISGVISAWVMATLHSRVRVATTFIAVLLTASQWPFDPELHRLLVEHAGRALCALSRPPHHGNGRTRVGVRPWRRSLARDEPRPASGERPRHNAGSERPSIGRSWSSTRSGICRSAAPARCCSFS